MSPPLLVRRGHPGHFSAISVAAARIYVRAHANVPYRRRLIPRTTTIVVERFVDLLLSTDHLRRYISERRLTDGRPTTVLSPLVIWCILVLLSLVPVVVSSRTSTQLSPIDRQLSFFGDFAVNSSSITTFQYARHARWHAGCCIRSKRFSLPECNASLSLTGNQSLNQLYGIDFLDNETLFCQRYDDFRYLSLHHLALFTYAIVIIGIILNAFVFLVLMCGSLRRSTSFVLFLALTVFDLLSLASSFFASLFRTVMTYLNTSAIFCKMFGIFFLYFRQCSSTTLLLIAIERCIVIKYPFCRHTFDRFRLPLLGLIMFIFVAPIPFDFIFYTRGTLHCEAFDTTQADRYQIFRGFFTVLSYAIVPFVGISISNFLIIVELKKSRKRFMTKDENGTVRRFSTK